MAAHLILTQQFSGTCLLCNCAPTDDENKTLPMATVPGMDVNWGEDVLICTDCMGVMADFIGRVDKEKFDLTKKALDKAKTDLEGVTTERDELQARIDRMLDGKKAVKEAREAQEAKK